MSRKNETPEEQQGRHLKWQITMAKAMAPKYPRRQVHQNVVMRFADWLVGIEPQHPAYLRGKFYGRGKPPAAAGSRLLRARECARRRRQMGIGS